jgi:hypothetical protein
MSGRGWPNARNACASLVLSQDLQPLELPPLKRLHDSAALRNNAGRFSNATSCSAKDRDLRSLVSIPHLSTSELRALILRVPARFDNAP